MQTLTFTQKLLRQRRFFSSLIPLLALFVGLGASSTAHAQSFFDDAVSFNKKPTGAATSSMESLAGLADPGDAPYSTYRKLGTSSTTPPQPTPDLGTYDIDPGGTSELYFTGGAIVGETSFRSGLPTGMLTAARVKYKTYLFGTAIAMQPNFSNLDLPTSAPYVNGGTQFSGSTNVNLLTGLLSGGTYVVEVRFELDNRRNSDMVVTTIVSPSYFANFTVTAPDVTPAGGTTTWISQSSNNWLLPANWSNGVPNSMSDAVIPEKSPDPTANTATPILASQDSTIYNVRNILLDGDTNSSRALLRIGNTTGGPSGGATLNVFGDLNVISSGILAASVGSPGASRKARNSTIVLRGGNQKIKGTLNIADLVISGTGIKSIIDEVNLNNTLVFDPSTSAGVITQTARELSDGTVVFSTTGTPKINLNGSLVSLLSPLTSETNVSYMKGTTLARRTLNRSISINGVATSQLGVTNTFGNVGLDIIPRTLDSDPVVTITRTVGDPLFSPVFPSRTASPVKRQYGVSGDINNAPSVSDIIFHYLDSKDELNGNNDENQLVIFRATNNGPPYALVGGMVDPVANTVRRNTITAINTITLGSKNNPLPVTLTAFDAKRVNTNALLTWQTASELNSKGYSVEVSTDGKEYRVLSFVASVAPNSTQLLNYSYTDTEKDKKGVRYYRIAQVDVNGAISYYAPRAVSFEGKATEANSSIVAYPNPLNSEILHLSLNSSVSGTGVVRVLDMTGRQVAQRNLAITIGSNDVAIENMSELKSGLYILSVMLPSGEKKTMKVVKQ